MKIAIVTNIRSPYRKLQIEEIAKDSKLTIKVYYTDRNVLGRKWNVEPIEGVEEIPLKAIEISKQYGNLNMGLANLVLKNDVILIGGYEKPTYILISLLCRLLKKPYILIYDGISPKKIVEQESKIKFYLKSIVIKKASAIFGNGKCSEKYFVEKFRFNKNKIFNQFLTVDTKTIEELSIDSIKYRSELREKYGISENSKVVLYSGRLIKRKNINNIVRALNELDNKEHFVLLILGDGEEKKRLEELAKSLNVNLIITGFIENQRELFTHYFIGDVLVLPSSNEPWGLVINEAMAAGLPVIASNECGASIDLVKNYENGFVIPADSYFDLNEALEHIFKNNLIDKYGNNSKKIVKEWNFQSSAKSFESMILNIMNKD